MATCATFAAAQNIPLATWTIGRPAISILRRPCLLSRSGPRCVRSFSTSILNQREKPRKEFFPAYDAKAVEEGWYEWWESQGFFKPMSITGRNGDDAPKFTMITPPPNVTGSLHIGHALTLSIEDAVVRWRRMHGYDVQWIPGTDHAGIGTQSVVEKMLMREKQVTRHDLGREDFVKEVWAWRKKYGDRILNQMRRMGASVDWDNMFFTMDQPRYEAVQNAFMQLYRDGLIYRNTRLVNWCCALETVISDIEVDYKEIEGQTFLSLPGRQDSVEFGVLHRFSYPIVDADPNGIQQLTVSTTRIETMLGDCAVAIHPKDERYQALHGKSVYHPILKRKLPIICDDQLVDMEFGTGVVKVTPAHDTNDYACALRHGLPIVSMFDKLGRLNEHCGLQALVGQDRFDVRPTIIDMLSEAGCYEGKDTKHSMRVAVCSRSGDVIEPMLQPQWYIRCKDLADISKTQVQEDAMRIHPEHHTQEWYRWLDNIQDWCISRQLWWGHEIPAYQIKFGGEGRREHKGYTSHEFGLLDSYSVFLELWVVASDEIKAKEEAQLLLEKEGIPSDTPYTLVKDEDVLDTWFSSALLPLSALGWKGTVNEPIPTRYPIQVMETGFDILFFWVSRMAMLANHFSKAAPFNDIFLHAMVRDAQGRKMSKSLGNVIDPLHVIEGVSLDTMKKALLNGNLPLSEIQRSTCNLENEYPSGIPPCGTDSLRFALVAYTQQTRQINLDISNVIQTSHFCNKLWNLFKFGLGRLDEFSNEKALLPKASGLSLASRYILSRMADTVEKCHNGFESYKLFEATDALRRFIVEDVCDVYVEFSKATLNKGDVSEEEKHTTLQVLHACMDVSLRLTHPFMPYITEELWQHLKDKTLSKDTPRSPSLMLESYPTIEQFSGLHDERVEDHFRVVLSIIHASRSLRQSHQISVGQQLPFRIWCDDAALLDSRGPLKLYMDEIKNFVKASDLSLVDAETHGASLDGWTAKAIDSKLKILVPTTQIMRAQLERAASKGGDLITVVNEKKIRFNKKLCKVKQDMEKLTARMSKNGYEEMVPEQIKENNRKRYEMLQMEQTTLENDLKALDDIENQL
ncbi:hypothetical protein EC973_005184 [Apophysomyces ossiformis]|uniref:valine--tRNA ligase n=1 Tax=Apophysomyces ossiformis TaxID=679940 RepID=A0A8H7ETM4_9FUNG|nr:hypothetical protein EC973_005184 [Apophysomyces ossiformis]